MNTPQSRFQKIAAQGEILFHSDDLARLWDIKNQNTLNMTLKRYADAQMLFRIYRGFYSIKPIAKIDPLVLGIKALHQYAYVSTETILIKHGIIQQQINEYTLISSKSCHFTIGSNQYSSRQLNDQFLYNPIGIITNDNGVKVATVERAIADMLYFNKQFYFDASVQINWRHIKQLQKSLGYPITKL